MIHKTLTTIILLFSLLIGISIHAQTQAELDFPTQDFEIEFDGWTSSAQLMLPNDSGEEFPIVILLHGSGPYDMNASSFDASLNTDEPISQNFLLIAEYLAENGYATLRFNKRGVNALRDYDTAQVQNNTLDILIEDANAVIDFSQLLPEVNSDELFLYGWSEGAWVASNLANMRHDINGLILQGAPNGSIVEVLPYQYQDIALDYLQNVVDTDSDGLLSLDDIADVPAGSTQLMLPFFFYEPGSPEDNPTINQFVDQNSDELIDIDNELAPAIAMYLNNLPAYLPSVEASYDTASLIAEVNIPTLLLHGGNDGWVSVTNSEEIHEASPENTTLNIYPDLGHALSQTEILAEDGFYPIDSQPLEDIITWLQNQ